MRSIVHNRAESAGALQVAVADPRSCRPMSAERPALPSGCCGSVGASEPSSMTRFADRVVLGDRAELAAAEPECVGVADVSQRGAAAGEQHGGQRSSHAPPRLVPGGMPSHLAFRLGHRPAEDLQQRARQHLSVMSTQGLDHPRRWPFASARVRHVLIALPDQAGPVTQRRLPARTALPSQSAGFATHGLAKVAGTASSFRGKSAKRAESPLTFAS